MTCRKYLTLVANGNRYPLTRESEYSCENQKKVCCPIYFRFQDTWI